jgi:hypothetical protein
MFLHGMPVCQPSVDASITRTDSVANMAPESPHIRNQGIPLSSVRLRVCIAASVVLGLACWPLVPKIAGSNPAEAVGFFGRKNPQHAFLRSGSKAFC